MDAESSSGVESVAEIPIFEMTNLNACIWFPEQSKFLMKVLNL
jgi:hypothetical protein